MSNIKNVAETAGVSIATVSNVLRGAKPVSPRLRKKVLDAVELLNYRADPIASGLKSKRLNTVALVLTRIENQFFPYIIDGIQRVTEPLGYSISFFISNNRVSLEKQHVLSLLNSHVAGIVLNSVAEPGDAEYFNMLASQSRQRKPVHIVSLERDFRRYGIDSVVIDNLLGGKMATDHLFDMGAQKIAHIAAPETAPWGRQRLEGYKVSLAEHNAPFRLSCVASGDFLPASGYAQTRGFLLNGAEFDSVFAANDMMAIGAVKALLEYGLNVPDDVMVIGYDNIFLASLITPPLSSVHVPIRRMGEEAAQMLVNRIENNNIPPDGEPAYLELPISLTPRRSTNAPVNIGWELY